jgi:hypothetical protein
MLARFQHSQFALKVYRLQEQSVVDHLRPKISQRFYGWFCFLVVTDNELILRWNPQLNSWPLLTMSNTWLCRMGKSPIIRSEDASAPGCSRGSPDIP